VFLAGFVIFTCGSAACGIAPTLDILIISRMVQAVGGAVIAALGSVMVTSYLASSLRGQALGFVAMFTMLGAALGPVVGGFLTSAFSWQYIFYVNLPVGILAIILGLHVLPRLPPVSPKARLDAPGVALVFVALGALIFGLTALQGPAAMTAYASLLVSLICWAVFYVREHRAPEPLIKFKLFSSPAFSLQNINVMLIQLGMAGVMILMPFYLEMVKGIPTDNAGTILLALPIGMILTSPIAGRISDVIGTKRPIIIGFAVSAAALFFLSTLSAHSSVGHAEIYLFLLGAGSGFAYAPLNSAVMGAVPPEERGSTSGLIKMMTNLGSSLGVALVMLVATAALGPKLAEVSAHTLPAADLAGAFDAAFLFLMCIEILAVILMFAVKATPSDYSTEGEPVAVY
jgi:EmrB/QacA subfamily drug resistance transporter